MVNLPTDHGPMWKTTSFEGKKEKGFPEKHPSRPSRGRRATSCKEKERAIPVSDANGKPQKKKKNRPDTKKKKNPSAGRPKKGGVGMVRDRAPDKKGKKRDLGPADGCKRSRARDLRELAEDLRKGEKILALQD